MSEPTRKQAALDVHGSVMRLGEMVAAKVPGGSDLWKNGLGDLVELGVSQCNLPRAVTAVDLGRELGLVPRGRAKK